MADPFKAVGNYFAAKTQAKTASKAASAQTIAAQEAVDVQHEQINVIR
jgi:hypothetical protein